MAAHDESQSRLRFGTFEVDLAAGEIYKRGVPVPLQEKPFQLLVLLLERPGQIVTREDLQKRLWSKGTYVDFDKSLNTAVKKLRYALGDSPDKPVFIQTLPRRGYRFLAPISGNGFAANGAPAFTTTETVRPPVNQKFLLWLAGAFLAAALAMLATYKWTIASRSLDLKNAQFTELTNNGNVRSMAISANGRYVTYAQSEGLEQSLWLKEVSSGAETQLLTPDTVNFPGLEFSPDGKFIYFIRSEKSNPVFGYLCKMPAAGGPVEELIRDADSPVSFSPDGKQLVYTRGYPPRDIFEVRIANSDGTHDHLFATISGHQVYQAGPTWSPSNNSIAVPAHLIGQHSRFVLFLVSLSSRTPAEVFSSTAAIGRPLWLKGDHELLVTLEDARSHKGQLWTISYPDGKARRFTNDLSDYSAAIDLTQDGDRLVTIVRSVVSNVWIASAKDLSHPYQITSGEPSLLQVREISDRRLLVMGNGLWTMENDGSRRFPFASLKDPDDIEACGRFALAVTNQNGNSVLTRMRLDGSNPTALASGDILYPACSADGRAYYLNFAHPEKIRRISLEDGSISEVANVLGDTLFGNLAVSPDGNYLAYPYQRYSPPAVELAIIPEAGGNLIKQFKVPGFVGPLRWSPDGSALQYVLTSNDASNLWEQSLHGGKPKSLTHFNSGRIFDFSWSADREHIFLTRGQSKRDVVLLSDLRQP